MSVLLDISTKFKAGFPLGEFVRANKQKANVIGWWWRQCLSPANQVAFFSVRANKFAKWKTGLKCSEIIPEWLNIVWGPFLNFKIQSIN